MKFKLLFTVLTLVAYITSVSGQRYKTTPPNWQHMDPEKDKVYGVSATRAYAELLQGKTGKTVIVAVIDGGTDIYHEDLIQNLWVNAGEIPNNGIDDDKNGYIDDIHGWNYIGGKDGRNIQFDTYEYTRLYAKWFKKYKNLDSSQIASVDHDEYKIWLKVQDKFEYELEANRQQLDFYQSANRGVQTIIKRLRTRTPTITEVTELPATSKDELNGKKMLITFLSRKKTVDYCEQTLTDVIEYFGKQVNYYLNIDFNPRPLVGDAYEAANQRNYGNKDVKGPEALHGTHVAGIIGAIRGNGLGIEGIAANIKIMIIRVVPDGDERDKDVANGILYAVQNGATIINMSFGKNFVYNKKTVDDAIRFAMSKDVLMIHAAGNNSECNDSIPHYPTADLDNDSLDAQGWIEVGASTWKTKKELAAEFSNFGERSVDVFAPGYDINSTVPDSNQYKEESGTSMAAPVTAGVAAVIRSFYPELTAAQVKECIEKSVVKIKGKVYLPGSDNKKKVKFKKLCKSGGIVNLYKALQYAATMKPPVKPDKK